MAEKPTDEMKKQTAEMGAVLQKIAPEVARDVNLHRPYRPQLLADSVKVKLELSDDWKFTMTVTYGGEDLTWSEHYLTMLTLGKAEDLPLLFLRHLRYLLRVI